jgi:CDP-diacylglycerol--serine O-phosphatidyltransferase
MDPLLPRLEDEERRRRHRLLFRHNKIPVRMLVPNFFTLLSLCAGLTAIRMAIELRYELAIALVVIAALLDGVDGRLARALKAQSRFGAELDSLADFVNFGVAPAVILFIWGLGGLPRGFGWIVALVFALATGLRLARFNTMLEVEKPKWQSDYFTGMPVPAGAIAVLLPLYLDGLGLSMCAAALADRALHGGHGGDAGFDHPDLLCASSWASASRASSCCRYSSALPRWLPCSLPIPTAR